MASTKKLSVVMVNMVMEDVEKRALETFTTPLKCWKQYVDDVFCIAPKDLVASLFQHINNIEPSIQFTLESENAQGYLPLLDVQLQRSDEGSISTSVYRKPIHTDKYLDFTSRHLSTHKNAVVRTLFSRANTHSSSTQHLRSECERIYGSLCLNHYPASFVRRLEKRPT